MSKRTVFTGKAVDQIRETYSRLKSQPFGGSGPKHEPRLWNPGTVRAIVTTAITPCVDTPVLILGSGAVSIYRPINGVYIETDTDVPVSNWSKSSGTIPINTHVKVSWCDGEWDLTSRDC